MKDKQAVQIDTKGMEDKPDFLNQNVQLIKPSTTTPIADSILEQKLKEQEVLLEAQKEENEKLKDQINSMEYAIVRWTDNEYEDVVCINKEVAEEYVKKYSDLAGLGKCYVDKDIYLPLREA